VPPASELGTAGLTPDHDILQHRRAIGQGNVLERAANADRRDAVARDPQDGTAPERDVAGIGLEEPAEAVEQPGFAGSIRANQAGDLSGKYRN
jgi:hypothetical protein